MSPGSALSVEAASGTVGRSIPTKRNANPSRCASPAMYETRSGIRICAGGSDRFSAKGDPNA